MCEWHDQYIIMYTQLCMYVYNDTEGHINFCPIISTYAVIM